MWPEVFAEAGYTVGGMGKWHNDRRSFARAFRRGGPVFFGGMTDQSRVPVYDIDPSGGYQAGKERVERTHSSTLFTDSAIRFVRGHHGPEPFLLYVAYTSPHDPRTAPPPFDTMYDPDRLALPPSFMPEHPFDNGELNVRDELLAPFPRTPEVIRRHIADYYGIISHLDHEIGRLLAALDETGRGRDTIVIFAGDNGLALGRHGLMGKQSVYDHSLRVPLIMAGPGVPPGVRRHGLCYLLDVFPTVCDLTGVASPSTVEGRSLAPTMRSAREGLRPDLFLAYRNLQRSVRGERWKLIEYRVNGQSRTQLFDMKADPWEMRDLSDDPRRATEVSQLRRRLGEWQREVGDPMAGKW